MKLKIQDRPTAMQRRLLVAHMKETRYIEGKGKERKYQWAKITTELNAVGPPKTLAQWKKQWQNLRLSTRRKLQEISRRHPGSPIPELTEEDNEIICIESTQPDTKNDTTNSLNDSEILTNFKHENLDHPSIPSTSGNQMKLRKKFARKIKSSPHDDDDDWPNINYVQPRTKASMEINSRAFRGLCEQAKKGRRKKKHMNSDELFMLSFVEDLKKIPEYRRLDVKTDIIAVFKKWSFKSQETQYSYDSTNSTQNDDQHEKIIYNMHLGENTFDTEKKYLQRPVSQLSQHSNSLGTSNLPLNLQHQHHHQDQSSPLHSVQQLVSSPNLQQMHQQQMQHQQHQHLQQHQHHQQQQQHHQTQAQHLLQHHIIPTLPNQHFPIYHRYGL